MTSRETTFAFGPPDGKQQVGIIHHPEEGAVNVGLLIVVGGPQYRIGAHRQYVHLARYCADQGIPVMRFDYQGVGDSGGSYPGFENVAGDIHGAIEEFLRQVPGIQSVALWGLCEGASALLLGGADHPAVSRVILANPWVRSESGLAKAYVKHYYLDRLKNPDFWRKIVSGRLDIITAVKGFLSNIRRAFGGKAASRTLREEDNRPFPDRMLSGLKAFPGRTLLIMSQNDLVAREFDDLVSADRDWKNTLRDRGTDRIDIAGSDHTFSTESWRMAAAVATSTWLLSP